MSTTRILSVALVTVVTISAAHPRAQSVSEGDLLRTWLSAVVQHRPGQADAAASLVANWSAAEVELLLPGLFFYLDQVRQGEFKNRDIPKCSTCAVSRDERERLLRVTKPRVSRTYQALVSNLPKPDRLNDLLLRAVTLHSDATMMFPKNAGQQLTGAPAPSTNVLGAHRSEVQTLDGQYFGSTPVAPHWYLARALLNFTLPEPALDGRARRWYLAASTYFAATSDAAHIAAHFAAMGTLFPDDAMVMFDLGWLAEAHSTARMQTHRRALVDAASRRFGGRQGAALCSFIPCDGNRNPYGIKNERESLLDAERYFARAVALDPTLTEAHVRLAHVVTRLGRPAEADSMLRKLTASEDPLVQFYGAMVEGKALEALDQLDEAYEAYQRALALFPNAQSTNLSISALQHKRGDTASAAVYAQRAVDAPPVTDAAADPMRVYQSGRGPPCPGGLGCVLRASGASAMIRRLRSGTSSCKVRVVQALAAIVAASGAAPAAQSAAEPGLRRIRRRVRVALSLTFSVAAAFTAAVPLPATLQGPQATLAPAREPSHVVLRKWLEAVSSHRPGDADAAAQAIASWTADDLEQLLPGLVWYLDLARSALQKQPGRVGEPADVCPTCDASRRERTRLLRATRSRAPHDGLLKDFPRHDRPEQLNDLIVRGVMLHSDAAMRFRVAAPAAREQPAVQRRSNTPGSYNVLQIPPEIVNSTDGAFMGTTAAVGHWYLARALLQFMMPEPALTPLTRQWYLAATAHFAATTNFAQLESHLAAAQALFPNDAALAFDRGWQAELAAGPLIQHDVRALLDVALQRAPRRRFSPLYCGVIVPCDKDNNPYGVKNVRESLADAERAFARAIALDATMTEAHVRLAHVRLLLGRPTDALRQLERLPQSEDAVVSFYAALIKGKALEAVDRFDDAATAYHRGLELFPEAASVNLALSSIEQRRGDASRAASFARRAVETPDGNAPGVDPFAAYFLGRGRTVDEAWRRFVAALEQPQ